MTRGTASPSHQTDHPTASVPAVRPVLASSAPSGSVTSSRTFSKLLVAALATLFVVATLAFFVALANAGRGPADAPGTPAIPAGAVVPTPAADAQLAAADAASDAGTGPAPDPGAAVDLAAAGSLSLGPVVGASPDVADIVQAPSPAPLGSPDPSVTPDPSASPGPIAIGLPALDPEAIVELRMPFVPVIGYWGTQTAIARADLVDALTGGRGWGRVLIPTGDRAAIEGALGITIGERVEEADPAAIEQAMKSRKQRNLGILRASDVTFRVRALGINDRELFGNDRVQKLDNWPLVATVQGPAGSVWDQRSTWTLVAGGDSFTDRGIYERVVNRGKGIDYPFDGGTARVTGHYCCGPYVIPGHPVPSYRLAGPKGIVRDMVKNADLAIANHESPIPDNWVFHLHGFVFSGKPALTKIFRRAGIDWMSLANNHIKDFGSDGIVDTRKNLDAYGIRYAGAGKNLKQAAEYSILDVKGVKVAILPCSSIGLSWTGATSSSGGVMPCKPKRMAQQIREAKTRADFVIVFPHWGVEYDRDPLLSQQKWAERWAEAGADLVVGAHSHVAGAIGEFDGMPVFYSLGNFIFDQNWATYTMESVLLEATFHGKELVQLRLHPFLSHDQAQPNFLDPATDDGKALMKAVRRASLIDW